MTVPYTSHLATSSFPGFIRAMLIWRGSAWKLVYSELLIWFLLFLFFSLIYRFALGEPQQTVFEKFCVYCYMHVDLIPFEFILGYYISLVVTRWSKLWINLGFLDNTCLTTMTYLRHGDKDRAQLYRRNIVRMILLYQVMVYRIICPGVRKMYPTLESLAEAGDLFKRWHRRGYINDSELNQFAENKFWMPIKWCMYLIRDARKEGLIVNDLGVQKIYEFLTAFRENVIYLWLRDWVPIPLAYTQIAYASIRIYFIVLIFGRQFLDAERTTIRAQIDVYLPLITIIQFIVYVGWCKMGETMVNPFGSDDDDYDYKFVLTRNLNVGMDIVTGIEAKCPPLVDDDGVEETTQSFNDAKQTDEAIGLGSIANMNVRKRSSHAPLIMVKRSEVNALRPTELRRFRSNSAAIGTISSQFRPDFNSGIEFGMSRSFSKESSGERRGSFQKISIPLVNPKVLLKQCSCPSKFTNEKVPQILGSLSEADESLEHSSEDERRSSGGTEKTEI